MMFAALSGSSPATVVAIGPIVIAAMRSGRYSKDFAAGVNCNAGALGILIPPPVVMVVSMEIGMITSPAGLAADPGDGAADGYSLIGYP